MASRMPGEPDRGGEQRAHEERQPAAEGDHLKFAGRVLTRFERPRPLAGDDDGREHDDQHADDGELPAEVGVRPFADGLGDLLHRRGAGVGRVDLLHEPRRRSRDRRGRSPGKRGGRVSPPGHRFPR